MKKTIFAIILAALFIINIVAAAFLFTDIQVMKFPKTTIRIDIIELNAEEVIIYHNISMDNPNSFEMMMQDFQILVRTEHGQQIASITIDGGSIKGNAYTSFAATDKISLTDDLSGLLTSTITGVIGVNVLGVIKKTIPLELTVYTSIEDVLSKIALPSVIVRTEFGQITRDSIELIAELAVSNTNPFAFFFDDITLQITSETDEPVGDFRINATMIPAESQVTLRGTGNIRLQALNAKKLFILVNANAGVLIAGLNKTLPFTTNMEIQLPDINTYIPEDTPLELSLGIDLRYVRGGFQGTMVLEVFNPTKIPFLATDIIVDYYGVKNNEKYFVAQGAFGSTELTPENTTILEADIFLPRSALLNIKAGGLLPDMVFAQLRTKLSLHGLAIALPVAIGSYVDIKLFRATS